MNTTETYNYRGYIISFNPKPIPTTVHDYDWVHEDYDGAPDGGDNRCGTGESIDHCYEQINEQIFEDTFDQIERDFHSWCFQGQLFDFVNRGERDGRWKVVATVGTTASYGGMIRAANIQLQTGEQIYLYTEAGSWRFIGCEPFTSEMVADLKRRSNERTNTLIKKVCELT